MPSPLTIIIHCRPCTMEYHLRHSYVTCYDYAGCIQYHREHATVLRIAREVQHSQQSLLSRLLPGYDCFHCSLPIHSRNITHGQKRDNRQPLSNAYASKDTPGLSQSRMWFAKRSLHGHRGLPARCSHRFGSSIDC